MLLPKSQRFRPPGKALSSDPPSPDENHGQSLLCILLSAGGLAFVWMFSVNAEPEHTVHSPRAPARFLAFMGGAVDVPS
jgi:hypothetical protein